MATVPFDLEKATQETTTFLQELIRFDTTNPPGNETPCARHIAGVFDREGIPAEVVEPLPGRGSVVARLKGDSSRRPLLLLSHLDVVPAVASDWKRHPFAGDLVDGEVWGRGALDTKNLTAVWMEVMLQVKRLGLPLSRDLIFAATADEEMGGVWGLGWLVENRPELVDAEFCLNEGGGQGLAFGDRTVYVCQTAEKGICWTRVTARGTAGHASMPHDDNPVVHLAAVLHRLGTTRLPMHVTDTFRLFVERLAAALGGPLGEGVRLLLDPATAEQALALIGDRYQVNTIRAMSRNTACPTVLHASEKTNVIPQTATAMVDCRILPGQTPETLLGELRELLGLDRDEGAVAPAGKIELELDRTSLATESPAETPLMEALAAAVSRHNPGAAVVPYLVPGATDSRFLRPRGTVAYGFCPLLPGTDLASVHGINERIPVASLRFALQVLWEAVSEVAGRR